MGLMEHVERQRTAMAARPHTDCKVCGQQAEPFEVVDFLKTCDNDVYRLGLSGVPVYYHRCTACDLVFTRFFDHFSGEDWRTHVYNERYVEVDPDYVERRPRMDALRLDAYLCRQRQGLLGLDYGGGAGVATRLMRGLGYDYDCYDPFGTQLLTPGRQGRYNFCSTFEVAEHSPEPLHMFTELTGMLSPDKVMVLVGTQVHDGLIDRDKRLSWWYAGPRNGHVTLYSRKALGLVAQRMGLDFHSFTRSTHVMTRGHTAAEVARFVYTGVARRRLRAALKQDPLRGLPAAAATGA